jgi:hypothetical protein
MDPASVAELQDILFKSDTRLQQQEEQATATGRAIQALVIQVSELTKQVQQLRSEAAVSQPQAAVNPPAPVQTIRSTEPRLPSPACYSGESQLCRSFLAKCSLYISLQPSAFPTEESKVAFVITLLAGRAGSWGTTVWEQRLPCCASFQAFSSELRKVFDRAASGRDAARLLAELRQGERTVTDYSIEFRTLAAECGWNAEAQWDMFLHGLSEYIKDEIYALELPTGVDKLIDLAVQVDTRLRRRDRRSQRGHVNYSSDHTLSPVETTAFPPEPEPMQLGRSRLSSREKQRRKERGLCFYCGTAGHFALQCPVKASTR